MYQAQASRVTGKLRPGWPQPRQPFLQGGEGKISDDGAGVAADDEGGIAVGGVDDHLHRRRPAGFDLAGEIIGDLQDHGYLVLVDEAAQLRFVVDEIFNGEVFRGGEAGDEVAAVGALGLVVDGHGHVLDVEVDGVAVGDELNDGGQEDERRSFLSRRT